MTKFIIFLLPMYGRGTLQLQVMCLKPILKQVSPYLNPFPLLYTARYATTYFQHFDEYMKWTSRSHVRAIVAQ